MSVAAQQLDYLHTALRALGVSSQNQYLIRGQPRFDKVHTFMSLCLLVYLEFFFYSKKKHTEILFAVKKILSLGIHI